MFHTLFKNVSIGIDMTRFLPRRIRDHIDKTAAKAEKDAHILLMKGDVVEEGSESACQDVIAVVDVEPPPGPHQRSPISPADPVPFDSHQQRTDASPSPAPSDSPKPLSRVERLLAWLNSRTTIDFQIIVVMALTGIVGTFVSGGIGSIKNSGLKFAIKIYIGAMVLSMGVVIFLFTCRKWSIRFAIWKIALLGAVTGFNKVSQKKKMSQCKGAFLPTFSDQGISGGGYGPISVSGQVISGRPERNAIATTSASEAVICLSGIIASFAFATGSVKENYALVPWLIIGSCVSVPFSAYATRVVRTKPLRYIVAVSTTILGCYAIVSAVLAYLKIWNSGGGGG